MAKKRPPWVTSCSDWSFSPEWLSEWRESLFFYCTFYSYFSFSYHMYALVLCYLYNLYSYYFALSTERTWFDYISLLIIPCITIMWQIKKPWPWPWSKHTVHHVFLVHSSFVLLLLSLNLHAPLQLLRLHYYKEQNYYRVYVVVEPLFVSCKYFDNCM